MSNPFDTDAAVRGEAGARLDSLELPAVLREMLDAGETEDAERLLLAVAHRQARPSPGQAAGVLTDVSDSLWARVPHPRADYARVALAAARGEAVLDRILGGSAQMHAVRRATWAACFGDSLLHALKLEPVIRDHDVLLLGETGTGKEAFARAIQAGALGDAGGGSAPASAINAASVPDTLVESALFGHVKGAFTGADEHRLGRLRSAHRGSFFLDEVGDLPTPTQVKLLRVIETNEVFPLGSDTAQPADVRYIAATHKDLEAMVERGEFRRDLYQRLAGIIIRIPPLRDRAEDIVDIGRAFVRSYLRDLDVHDQSGLLDSVESWLQSAAARSYPWPGNVRELQNALRNLLLGLQPDVAEGPRQRRLDEPVLPASVRDATASMQDVTDWYLRYVLARCEGNLTRAAKILGVDRSTVRRRFAGLGDSTQ